MSKINEVKKAMRKATRIIRQAEREVVDEFLCDYFTPESEKVTNSVVAYLATEERK